MSKYNIDFNLWLQEQASALRARQFSRLDYDNLIEEIEDIGRSQKRAVESLLLRLLEHILKLKYWDTERERCANHWESEIVNFRYQINKRIKESPSLKKHLEDCFEETASVARTSVFKLIKKPLPDLDWSLSEVLKEN